MKGNAELLAKLCHVVLVSLRKAEGATIASFVWYLDKPFSSTRGLKIVDFLLKKKKNHHVEYKAVLIQVCNTCCEISFKDTLNY